MKWDSVSKIDEVIFFFRSLGSDDFFGSTKTVEFKPGEFEKQFPIIVRGDDLPEVCSMPKNTTSATAVLSGDIYH